jgi:cell wall assembly regulator SMI1
MQSELIALVRQRAATSATRTDMDSRAKLCPVATDAAIDAAERELGFPLPATLRVLYTQVGNGGFGIIGLAGGHTDDLGDDVVRAYKSFAQTAKNGSNWLWPGQLLRLTYWGCAIYSCVDCSKPEAPVIVWDPNCWSEDKAPPESAMAQESPSLEAWIADWAAGTHHWDRITELTASLYPE